MSATATSSNLSCNGSNNGIGAVTYTGATGSVSFLWQPSLYTTQTAFNLSPGIHSITVTDAINCSVTKTVSILNPPSLTINSLTNTSSNCGLANGSATVYASGGTGSLGYTWNPGGYSTSVISGITAGTYSVMVYDINGCTQYGVTTINDITPLISSTSSGSVLCNGFANGYAGVSVLNGMGPLTYLWSYQGQTTPTVTNLPMGLHTVIITDANNCVTSATFNIAQPTPLNSSISSTNASCFSFNNGQAIISVSGGNPPYTYSWSPSGQTTATLSNAIAGTYSVTVKDVNNCSSISTVTITQPPPIIASLTGTATCTSNTFSMNFSPTGGVQPYSYSWTPGSYTTSNVIVTLSSPSTYTAIAIDAIGCAVTSTINAVPQVTASITSTNISCMGANDGIAIINPIGASGPVSFIWQPNVSTSQMATGLPAGIYTVTMTDANNCSVTKTVSILNPPALTINSLTNTSTNCGQANGSATVIASGGTGSLSYQWNSNPSYTQSILSNVLAGTYTITVTDVNGCMTSAISAINDIAGPTITSLSSSSTTCFGQSTGSASVTATGFGLSYLWSYLSQTTPSVINLPQGIHTVTVSDFTNCLAVATITISQATQLNATISSFTNVACNGMNNGGATASANGGSPAYTYSWAPVGQTFSVLSNVSAGTYTLIVKDANNCVGTNTVAITQPYPLIINTNTVNNVSCNGGSNGSISASVTGGNSSYTYSWSPSLTSTTTVTNLSAGSYTFMVTDNMGCVSYSTYTVYQPAALVATTNTLFACAGINGSATVTPSGGTAPYSYNWNTSPPQTANIATGLTPGNYTLIISDNNGCVFSKSVSIASAPLPTISISSSNSIICYGGAAYLTASGANTYFWSTGNNVAFIMVTPTVTTNYTVTGTNTNGCSNSAVITQSVTDCTSISELNSHEIKLEIYPNPFTQAFNVKFSAETKETEISIYNINGQQIFSQKYFSNWFIPVNACELPAGLFFIEVNADGKKSRHKVVRE